MATCGMWYVVAADKAPLQRLPCCLMEMHADTTHIWPATALCLRAHTYSLPLLYSYENTRMACHCSTPTCLLPVMAAADETPLQRLPCFWMEMHADTLHVWPATVLRLLASYL